MNNLEDVAMIMNPELDQVAIAKENIPSGYHLKYKGDSIVIETLIEKGHRFALVDIKKGEFVRQYGYPFGQSNGILKGESITSVNVDNVLPEIDLKNFIYHLLHNHRHLPFIARTKCVQKIFQILHP